MSGWVWWSASRTGQFNPQVWLGTHCDDDDNDDDNNNNNNNNNSSSSLILNVAFYISMSLTLRTESISIYTCIWSFLLLSVCMNCFQVDDFGSPVRVFGTSPLNNVMNCLPWQLKYRLTAGVHSGAVILLMVCYSAHACGRSGVLLSSETRVWCA